MEGKYQDASKYVYDVLTDNKMNLLKENHNPLFGCSKMYKIRQKLIEH